MQVTAWANGGGMFGIRVGSRNRETHFSRSWIEVEVKLDGEFHRFAITESFWDKCPEFRGSVVRHWLRRHGGINWPKGEPPRFELGQIGGNRFELVG